MAGVELATAYVSIVAETGKLKKQITAELDGVDGRAAGRKLSSGVAQGLTSGNSAIARAGSDAARAYEQRLQSEIRGEKIGTAIGTATGKAIGFGLKVGIAGAATAATAALGGVTLALTKGFTRLKNIDNATFKLKALGNSSADVKKIMDSALKSVKGTAFGLDSAANTAATAVAAGVPNGQSLTDYLTNVADAAAIAQTSLDEMGSIFNKVQTNGKAMTDDLQMLADRGLPIFTWLQKQYGVTGEALSKMVQDGKVSAADFQRAIHDNIGGAAQGMGQSFEGAIQNVNAALGRIGATILAPAFNNASGGIGSLTDALDNLNDWLGKHQAGLIDFWSTLGHVAIEGSKQLILAASDMLEAVAGLAGGIGNVQGAITKFQAWQADFRGDHDQADQLRAEAEEYFSWGEGLQKLSDRLADAANGVGGLHDKLDDWADKAKAATTVTNALGDSFKNVNENGQIIVESNAMDKIGELNDLGLVVKNLPDGSFEVVAGTPAAQALIDAFVAKNQTLPPAKLPVDVDTGAAAQKLRALYNDIFKAPGPDYTPPVATPGSNPLLAGPQSAGYVPYDPSAWQRPAFGGGRAAGGAITGPGGPRSDSIAAFLSNGEHVLTAKDVQALGGQGGVYAFRNALHRRDGGPISQAAVPWKIEPLGYADGGAVGGGAVPAIDYAYNSAGQPYQYGQFDCSMYMSQIYARMAGLPPGRYFNTESDFAALGFKKGYKPGALNIGIRNGGGGPNSHMAGTLPNGINVENSSNGSMYGPGAAGAQDFANQWYYEGPALSGDQHGTQQGAAPGPGNNGAGMVTTGDVAQGAGNTEGYIPSGAGSTGVPGTSMLSGFLNLGSEAIGGLIDTAASAAATAATAAAAAGGGGGAAAGPAISAGIQMGAQAAKRGVQYGFQMVGILGDSLLEQAFPVGGAPRWLGYDYTQFAPHLQLGAVDQAGQAGAQAIGSAVDPNATAHGQGQGAAPGPGPVQPAAPAQPPAGGPTSTPTSPPDPNNPLNIFGFDQGGWLEPGMVAINHTNRPEPVFTGAQWDQMGDVEPAGRDAPLVGTLQAMDMDDAMRQLSRKQRLDSMQYAGRP